MAPNDSFMMEFMLSSPLPHWIELNRADVYNQLDIAEMMACDTQDYIIKNKKKKNTAASTLLSLGSPVLEETSSHDVRIHT